MNDIPKIEVNNSRECYVCNEKTTETVISPCDCKELFIHPGCIEKQNNASEDSPQGVQTQFYKCPICQKEYKKKLVVISKKHTPIGYYIYSFLEYIGYLLAAIVATAFIIAVSCEIWAFMLSSDEYALGYYIMLYNIVEIGVFILAFKIKIELTLTNILKIGIVKSIIGIPNIFIQKHVLKADKSIVLYLAIKYGIISAITAITILGWYLHKFWTYLSKKSPVITTQTRIDYVHNV